MAQIGTADKLKLYIVKKADDPPSADSKFTDYTDYIISWNVKGGINQIAYFEAILAGDLTDAEKLDVTKGNLVYILAGTKLVGKFVLSRPNFRTDYTVILSGEQSSGTGTVANPMKARKVARETTPIITYENYKACDILKSTDSACEGLLVDQSQNTILCLSPTNPGTADPYSLAYDYDNKIKAINKFADVTQQEWWITHGINDTAPYSEGDYLNVSSRKGSSSTTKTFYFTGLNQDATISSGMEEIETNANHVVVKGQDQVGTQVEAIAYDATCRYTEITCTKAIDGWLLSDINSSCDVLPLTAESMGGLVGQIGTWTGNYAVVRIDQEVIRVGCITGTPPCLCDSSTYSFCRGYRNTEATPHKKGADVIVESLNETIPSPMKIYVDNTAMISGAGCVLIGNEMISFTNYSCVSPGYIYNISRSFWGQMYAHGDCILVRDGRYTPSDPASDCNSIYCCGLYSGTFSNNVANTKNALDKQAQRIMLTKRYPIKRITINAAEAIEAWGDVNLGDTITLGDGAEIGFTNGELVRITGFTFSYEGGMEKLELYCNDADARVYSSSTASYVDEKARKDQSDQQQPIRTYSKTFGLSSTQDSPNTLSQGNRRVTNVLTPTEDQDVANKAYVDSCASAIGLWGDAQNPWICASNNCGICVINNMVTCQCITAYCDSFVGNPAWYFESAPAGSLYVTSNAVICGDITTDCDVTAAGNLGGDCAILTTGVYPLLTGTGNVGEAGCHFDAGYFTTICTYGNVCALINLIAGGDLRVGDDACITDNVLVGGNVVPTSNPGGCIGVSGARWCEGYFDYNLFTCNLLADNLVYSGQDIGVGFPSWLSPGPGSIVACGDIHACGPTSGILACGNIEAKGNFIGGSLTCGCVNLAQCACELLGGGLLWVDGDNPFIIPCNSCGVCAVDNIYSAKCVVSNLSLCSCSKAYLASICSYSDIEGGMDIHAGSCLTTEDDVLAGGILYAGDHIVAGFATWIDPGVGGVVVCGNILACGPTSDIMACGDVCAVIDVCAAGDMFAGSCVCAAGDLIAGDDVCAGNRVCGDCFTGAYIYAGSACLDGDIHALCVCADLLVCGYDLVANCSVWICKNKMCIRKSDDSGWTYICVGTTSKCATIEYEPGKYAILKTEESPDVWFNDRGTTKICKGCGKICVDPLFRKVTEKEFLVQTTPLNNHANHWIEKGEDYFNIRTENTKEEIDFDWQISAIRKGFKNIRWKGESETMHIDGINNTFESYEKFSEKWRC